MLAVKRIKTSRPYSWTEIKFIRFKMVIDNQIEITYTIYIYICISGENAKTALSRGKKEVGSETCRGGIRLMLIFKPGYSKAILILKCIAFLSFSLL